MKTTVIYTLLFSFISCAALADVLIVDNKANSPSGDNIYSSVSTALGAALPGDTILITPSTASYSNISINKSITLMGGGWNAQNASSMYSIVNNISILSGISDVSISGLIINQITLGNTTGTVSNVIIEKNKLSHITTNASASLSNILIQGNWINLQTSTYCIYLFASNQSNILIQNNVISKPAANYGPYVTGGGVTFDHNLFADNGSRNAFYYLENCLVSNNIFHGASPTPNVGGSTITFENNLTYGAANNIFPTGAGYTNSGNIENLDPQFVAFSIGFYDTSKDATLGGASPALNAGSDGTDLGIYGGSSPFKDSGVSLPVVKKLMLPSSIVQGTNTEATIEVSGN